MSPTRQSMLSPSGRAVAGDVDEAAGDIDRDHLGPAPRRLDAERPGAAAGIEQAQAGHVGGQPRQQHRAHPVAAGADGGADAADRRVGGQPLPRLRRGAVEIGFEPLRDDRHRWSRERRWPSFEAQELEDVAVLHRLARRAVRSRPTSARRGAYIPRTRRRPRGSAPSRTGCIS